MATERRAPTTEQVQAMIDATVADLVSQSVFDAHTHNYRKITVIGVDDDDKYLSPDKVTIVDDTETVAATSVDAEAVGITVATEPTEVPN